MTEDPLISVIIPTYNEGRYLSDILKSIDAQTYKNYKVIIVDYNSDDSTRKIAKEHGAELVVVRKRGISVAKNKGLRLSKGDIIAFIDADYILSQTLFKSVVRAFSDPCNRNVVAIEPSMRVNNRDLNRKQRAKFKLISRMINIYKRLSYYGNVPAAYGCVFCRSDAVKKAGNFNENIQISEDKEFFSRIRAYGKFIMIKDTARMSYRRHAKDGIIRTELLYFYSTIAAFLTKKFSRHHVPVRGKD
jgi:glycosyltransferase involved in cell wall biosynthesis